MLSSRRHGARTNVPKWRAIAWSNPSFVSTASPAAPGWCASGGNHRGRLCRRSFCCPRRPQHGHAVLNRRPDENCRKGCARIPAAPTRMLERAGRLWRPRPDQSRRDKGRFQFDRPRQVDRSMSIEMPANGSRTQLRFVETRRSRSGPRSDDDNPRELLKGAAIQLAGKSVEHCARLPRRCVVQFRQCGQCISDPSGFVNRKIIFSQCRSGGNALRARRAPQSECLRPPPG